MKKSNKVILFPLSLFLSLGLAMLTNSNLIASADSVGATAQVNSGGLGFASAPTAITFPSIILNGTDQTVSTSESLDVADNRGAFGGWNVQLTAAPLTCNCGGANYTLPQPSLTPYNPVEVCDNQTNCIPAVNPGTIPRPLTLPTTPTKILNSASGSGVGNGTFNPQSFDLLVPLTTHVGTYSAIWSLSITSAP